MTLEKFDFLQEKIRRDYDYWNEQARLGNIITDENHKSFWLAKKRYDHMNLFLKSIISDAVLNAEVKDIFGNE